MGRRRARTTPSQHRSVRSSTGRHIGCACPTMPNADRADCGTARRHARASRLAPVRVSRTYIPHSCRRCVTVIVYPHRRHGRAVYVLVRSRCAAAGPAGAAPSAETAGGSPGAGSSLEHRRGARCRVLGLLAVGRYLSFPTFYIDLVILGYYTNYPPSDAHAVSNPTVYLSYARSGTRIFVRTRYAVCSSLSWKLRNVP
jgi:hypothetical protein